jgi:hypothetical protein
MNRVASKKFSLSLWTTFFLAIVALSYRTYHSDFSNRPIKVTTWDALGYYQYLPATFIYGDIQKLDWFEDKEEEYDLSNGYIYQFSELENGNRVGKYFSGVAIMQAPFFLVGHGIASLSDFKADGFSPPYQYSIAYGALIYLIISLFILRKILLKFFDEIVTAATLFLVVLTTNLIQYSAIEAGMSHGYIFLLYTLTIWFTIQWHEQPNLKYSAFLGLTMGLSIICRPTEIVIIFLPILWQIHHKESWKQKLQLLRKHKKLILYVALFTALAILPQIVYWKFVTDSFVHNVGSKWMFFNPWFRVLFGFEKGWFIYTPVTLFFIVGLFYLKNRPFRIALITFTLLNIWIVISWHEWRYGASYSTRALVQTLPVLALALASFIQRVKQTKFKYPALAIALYLTAVNIVQIRQYNQGILLADGMNCLPDYQVS